MCAIFVIQFQFQIYTEQTNTLRLAMKFCWFFHNFVMILIVSYVSGRSIEIIPENLDISVDLNKNLNEAESPPSTMATEIEVSTIQIASSFNLFFVPCAKGITSVNGRCRSIKVNT